MRLGSRADRGEVIHLFRHLCSDCVGIVVGANNHLSKAMAEEGRTILIAFAQEEVIGAGTTPGCEMELSASESSG